MGNENTRLIEEEEDSSEDEGSSKLFSKEEFKEKVDITVITIPEEKDDFDNNEQEQTDYPEKSFSSFHSENETEQICETGITKDESHPEEILTPTTPSSSDQGQEEWNVTDALELGKKFATLLKQTESTTVLPDSYTTQPDSEPLDEIITNQVKPKESSKSYEETLAEYYPKISKSLLKSFEMLEVPLELLTPASTYQPDSLIVKQNSFDEQSMQDDQEIIPIMRFKGGAVLYENRNCGEPSSEINHNFVDQQELRELVMQFSGTVSSEKSDASTIILNPTTEVEQSSTEDQTLTFLMNRSLKRASEDAFHLEEVNNELTHPSKYSRLDNLS